MSEPQRFFFVHLQKTAGTSLFLRLRRHLGRDAVYPTPEYEQRPASNMDVDLLREAFEQQGDRIRVVVGHFPLCTTELLGVPFTTLTVLRDPFSRTLSFLRHRRQLLTGDDPGTTLDELYRDRRTLLAMIHNHMTKMLGLTVDQMTHGMATLVEFDEAIARRAAENLERIDVVGLQERFDDFKAELTARFGWDLGEDLRANATTPRPGDVSEWLERRIRIDNALDFELYRRAVELVERRAAAER